MQEQCILSVTYMELDQMALSKLDSRLCAAPEQNWMIAGIPGSEKERITENRLFLIKNVQKFIYRTRIWSHYREANQLINSGVVKTGS